MNPNDLYEKLLERPTIELGGKRYYIFENDHKVSEDDLMGYAESICNPSPAVAKDGKKPSELVSATVDGRKMRWRAPAVLTWEMDEASFGGNRQRLENALRFCTAATEDWNKAAREMGIYDKIHFEPAGGSPPAFTFAFDLFTAEPNLLAVAFFPNASGEERVVYIGPGALDRFRGYDQVGIIRHELGHVLGARHEHIRPQATAHLTEEEKQLAEQWIDGVIGAEELTRFDGQSVMHYPIAPGRGLGTFDFEISQTDKEGFAALYAPPYDEATMREFTI